MSATNSAIPPRPRHAPVALVLLVAAGITAGWSLGPSHSRTFDYAYALLEPACIGTMCISALHRSAKLSRWLVPLLLGVAMLGVASRPHVFAMTAVGLAAGLLAILASLLGHHRSAIAATLICCSSIAATLLAGLLGEDGF